LWPLNKGLQIENERKGASMVIYWDSEPMPEEDKDKGGKGGSK